LVRSFAAEIAASLAGLPPEERLKTELWVDVLNKRAKGPMTNGPTPALRCDDLAAFMSEAGA
jgi:hypothetical protein